MPEPERPPLALVKPEPNPDTIRYLETLLKYARDGELRGLVGVAIWQGYSMTSLDVGRDGKYERSIVGQLEVVKVQVVDGIIEAEFISEEGGPDDAG